MNMDTEAGHGVNRSFNEWAVQVYHVSILKAISTDYLRTLRTEMLHVIGRIDDELKQREHART